MGDVVDGVDPVDGVCKVKPVISGNMVIKAISDKFRSQHPAERLAHQLGLADFVDRIAPVESVGKVISVIGVNRVIMALSGKFRSQLPAERLVQQRLLQRLQRRELAGVEGVYRGSSPSVCSVVLISEFGNGSPRTLPSAARTPGCRGGSRDARRLEAAATGGGPELPGGEAWFPDEQPRLPGVRAGFPCREPSLFRQQACLLCQQHHRLRHAVCLFCPQICISAVEKF